MNPMPTRITRADLEATIETFPQPVHADIIKPSRDRLTGKMRPGNFED
jgi:hypothetical protein